MLSRPCRAGNHTPDTRWVPELQRTCTAGQCIVCSAWFSLDTADEPMVDTCAAAIIQDHEAGEQPRTTHAEESGLASTQRWYGTDGWDAGWLASAHEHHDAILRDEEPAVGSDLLTACALIREKLTADGIAFDAAAWLREESDDIQPTVTIDNDGAGPAVQIDHLDSQDVSPMFDPAEAERLADDLVLGADAARQAAQDGFIGPAVVVELAVGPEPETGVEVDADEYEPGGEVCIADDITECECQQCLDDEHAWEKDQGWHDDGGDNDPDPDDCEPTPHPDTLAAPPRSWPPNTDGEWTPSVVESGQLTGPSEVTYVLPNTVAKEHADRAGVPHPEPGGES